MPKHVQPSSFGKLLDELRKKEESPQNRTQAAMAKKLAISPSLLSLWRSGQREPTSKKVLRISQVYDYREDNIWFTLRRYRMPLEAAIEYRPPGLVPLNLEVTPEEKVELLKYQEFLRIRQRLGR